MSPVVVVPVQCQSGVAATQQQPIRHEQIKYNAATEEDKKISSQRKY
jgi:hypothetical protein